MSLVQINAIREQLEAVLQRLSVIDRATLSPPEVAALDRAGRFVGKSIAAVARLEERGARAKADLGGDTD